LQALALRLTLSPGGEYMQTKSKYMYTGLAPDIVRALLNVPRTPKSSQPRPALVLPALTDSIISPSSLLTYSRIAKVAHPLITFVQLSTRQYNKA
jgi:hypothetical protein